MRAHGAAYRAQHPVTPEQSQVMRRLAACRTAALGGHWNVAQERFFYDLRPEAIKPGHRNTGIDLQAVEKALAVIEGYFARVLDALLGEGEPKGVHPGLRWMLAVQVAIQWTRTKRCRDVMVELSEKTMQAHADELVRRNYPDLPKEHYPTVTLKEHTRHVGRGIVKNGACK